MTGRLSKKDSFFSSIERRVWRFNCRTLTGGAFVVAISNAFWVIMGFLGKQNLDLSYGFTGKMVWLMIFLASAILVSVRLCEKGKLSAPVLSYLTLGYFGALTVEVTVLSVGFNVQNASAGGSSIGLALSSLYLFCVIFVPFVRKWETGAVCVMVLASLIVPLFAPGAEAYQLSVNAVMDVIILITMLLFRYLVIGMMDQSTRLEAALERNNRLTRECLETISDTIDAKSAYLHGHSKHVAEYAVAIAKRMGLSQQQQDDIYIAGLLHDVGKIGVPDSILDKPGKLTDEEFDVIKQHVHVGYDILKNMSEFPELAEAVLWHHQHYNGRGYPGGLTGEDIPLYSRIICVADSFDAMSARRAYKEPMPRDAVIAELERCRGQQFDPTADDVMLELLRTNTLPRVSDK